MSRGDWATAVGGRLAAGHARVLINPPNLELARIGVAKNLSVRDAERLAQNRKAKSGKAAKAPREKDALTIHYQTLEQFDGLTGKLGQ